MSVGVFQTSQPQYAAHRIATFPIGMNKRPAVRGYPRIGLRASAELTSKFVDAPALRQISRPISSIHIGKRHPKDMGDIDALARSMADLGLLQPNVIRPDDRLLAGHRRLATLPVRKLKGDAS